MNKGLKNKEKINQTIKLLLLNKITTSPYYSQTNEIVERNYKSIINTLTKIKDKDYKNQISLLPIVLQINQATTTQKTEIILYKFLYRINLIISIKAKVSTIVYQYQYIASIIEDILIIRI